MTPFVNIVLPPRLHAAITLPASKSLSARALVVSTLAGAPLPEGLSDCDDTAVLRAAIDGRPDVVDIHAAGTAMRFSTALFAVGEGEHVITGTERMRQRPIRPLVDALRSLGADIAYEAAEGYPPLRVKGQRLRGGEVAIAANVSSQYISALLMVAPVMEQGLTLRLEGEVASRPYIDMTLSIMQTYGATCRWLDPQTLRVESGGYRPDVRYAVEPDWSGASYWYELVALSHDPDAAVVLTGLREDSLQGDSVVRDIFATLGVGTTFTPDGALLQKAAPRGTFDGDFTACPDLAQTIVATAAALGRPFRYTGLGSLRIKETDRIAALQEELRKFGCTVEADEASMQSRGGAPSAINKKTVIATYDDHRMAMAFAPLAYTAPGLTIAHPGVVAKSYPSFWDDLKRAGATLRFYKE